MSSVVRPLACRPASLSAALASTCLALIGLALILLPAGAHAMKIQKVTSPGGLEAWLVEEHAVPLMALRYSFEGGSAQDPTNKEGVASFLTAMLDEGAGELTSQQFQERMEEIAMRMGFEAARDSLYGSFETLTQYRPQAVELLRLALTRPRFDQDAIERVRKQLLARLAYEARDPNRVASRVWTETSFPGHPYGRPASGRPETLATVTRDDLEGYRQRVFAKSTLKIVAVGDIDAKTLGALMDSVFGGLATSAVLAAVPATAPVKGGIDKVVEMDVPQSVAVFGHIGVARKDPDFIPAFVVNHVLGGGSFASRLMEEVREKRGLAYGVYTYLQPYTNSSIFAGSVATKNEEINRSLDVIKAELKRMAEQGPTPLELENAKKFLTGSYALRFDTNAKIADQLLAIKRDGFDIDYVDKRNGLIDAVTVSDAKRVAKRLITVDDLIITTVGKPVKAGGKG